MTCEQASLLLDSYVDGEYIDAVHVQELEAHLAECAGCRQELEALKKVRNLVRSEATYFQAPERLVLNVEAIGAVKKPAFRWRPVFAYGGLAIAALVFAVFWMLHGSVQTIEAEVVAGHIRSLQASHLYDVVSTDKHTVKPWFQGKVDFAPEVPDLTASGFTLVGGRLDYLHRHPVAALVYRRAKHVINVFVMRGEVCSANPTATTQDGYHIVSWSEHDLQYWAVSDMDAQGLTQFGSQCIAATP